MHVIVHLYVQAFVHDFTFIFKMVVLHDKFIKVQE